MTVLALERFLVAADLVELAITPTQPDRDRRLAIMRNAETAMELVLAEHWVREAKLVLERYTLDTWRRGVLKVILGEGPGWTAWQNAGGFAGTGMTHPEFVAAYEAEQAAIQAAQAAAVLKAQEDAQAAITPGLIAKSKPLAETALAIGHVTMAQDLGIGMAFNVKHPDAVAFLNNYGADWVSGVNQTTRDYIRTQVMDAVGKGESYATVARRIAARYTEFGVPSPLGHIRSRAELVAVTEMGNAYVHGNVMVGNRLKFEGLALEKRWLVTGDNRVCPTCRNNEAEGWVPWDKGFPSGHAQPLGHPGCRCDLQIQRAAGAGVPSVKQLKDMYPPVIDSQTAAKGHISMGVDGNTAIAKKMNAQYPGENWTAQKVADLKKKMQKAGEIPHNPIPRPTRRKGAQAPVNQGAPIGPGRMSPKFQQAKFDEARRWYMKDGGVGTTAQRAAAKKKIAKNVSARLANNPDWNDFVNRSAFSSYGDGPGADAVSGMLRQWASTSGDDNRFSLAMQLAAHDEFGLSDAARKSVLDHLDDYTRKQALATYSQNGAAYRAFLRAMYDNTQEEFARAGITEVSLYRGQSLKGSRQASVPDWVKSSLPKPETTTLVSQAQLRPMSSFAVDKATGRSFETMLGEGGTSEISTLFETTIPASRVIGTGRTGFGALHEYEWVVLETPGEMTWNVRKHSYGLNTWP